MSAIHLEEVQVRRLLSYDELIPAMKHALMAFSSGRVQQPVRTVVGIAGHSGWFAVMPAVYGNVMGAKMVTFYPNNVQLGKHTHLATITLFRSDTGEPLAVMDGRAITEMRTAAVSAIAVDELASKTAKSLAILGSGVQARSHFTALSKMRSFESVKVWSRTPEHAERFANEIGASVSPDVAQAVADADVVLTLTSSAEPILRGEWLKPDAMVCAIGAVTPERRELDSRAMQGTVIVESREAALKEPGDILLSGAEVTAELGELLNGKNITRKHGPVVFKSVGIAIEDIAAAKLVFEKLTTL